MTASLVYRCFFPVLSALLLTSGCTGLPRQGELSRAKSTDLARDLSLLSNRVEPAEAAVLADAAVGQSIALAREFHAVRPPWLHNVLVNHGFKERGLCFEWTNELFLRLHELSVHSLDLHLAVARMDTRREHNAIVVTAHGQPFETGLVLDAWRNSGRLWFGPVSNDKKYPWGPLPPERVNPEIRKRLETARRAFARPVRSNALSGS